MTTPVLDWTLWAPPLSPPVDGGLPADVAQAIADATWSTDPHLCAALQWETYAGMLPPAPAVASVSTGVQSVTYSPPAPGGDFGLAMQRATYHRSLMTSGSTVELHVADPALQSAPGNPWRWYSTDPLWWVSNNGTPPVPPPDPLPATASFTYSPASPGPNTNVLFDGSGSAGGDPGTVITQWNWQFGATERPDAGPSPTWRTPGGHGSTTAALDVVDEHGGTGHTEQVISW